MLTYTLIRDGRLLLSNMWIYFSFDSEPYVTSSTHKIHWKKKMDVAYTSSWLSLEGQFFIFKSKSDFVHLQTL